MCGIGRCSRETPQTKRKKVVGKEMCSETWENFSVADVYMRGVHSNRHLILGQELGYLGVLGVMSSIFSSETNNCSGVVYWVV